MTRPAWATTIGILMILFGGCGTFNHLKMSRTDDIIAVKDEIINNADLEVDIDVSELDSMEREFVVLKSDSLSANNEAKVDLKSTIEKFTHMTEYFKKWSIILGYVGAFVSVFYVISGIFFFYRKKLTPYIGMIALGLSIVFSIGKIMIFSGDSSSELMLGAIKYSTMFGIFIDIVLLVIVLISDKTYYTEPEYYND